MASSNLQLIFFFFLFLLLFFFLHENSLMAPEDREQYHQVHQACVQVHPKLADASEASIEGSFSPEVEEEANLYFQKIYLGQLSIDEVVNMLHKFKNSTNQR